MTKIGHTPGPWSVSRSGNGMGCVQLGKFRIAHRWDGSADQAEMDANARLIAAAPDLLDAVRRLVRNGQKQGWNNYYSEDMEDALAAIDKAEGRT